MGFEKCQNHKLFPTDLICKDTNKMKITDKASWRVPTDVKMSTDFKPIKSDT